MNTKKILAFGAHPDDVEFGCGGLLIKEIENGAQVKIVICSLGEAGTNGTPESRKEEATNAAKFIGAEVEFIDLGGDCHIGYIPENSMKLAGIIREYKPNIVLTTSQTENQHPDHKAVSKLAHAASRMARYGGLKELNNNPVHAIDALYYYPSSAEFDKKPDLIIDVSAQYDKWEKAMSMHESQMKTRGYINLVQSRARALGASIGVEYATMLWVNDTPLVGSVFDLGSSRKY